MLRLPTDKSQYLLTHFFPDHRAAKITTAMAGMDDRIKKYEQDMQARKPKKDIFYMLKRAKELGKYVKK